MTMNNGCITIFGGLIAITLVITLAIYVVAPLSGFILLGIVSIGLCSGAVVAVRNFGEVLLEAHKHER